MVLAVQDKATVCVLACAPVPDKVIVAGEPVALLVTVTLPLAPPAALGAKMTLNVMVCDGLNVTGVFAPLTVNPAPLAVMPEICTFELPVFVMVMPCVDEEPTVTLPKFTLVGLNESVCVAATPVPLNASVPGDPAALLTSETLPLTEPAVAG